ncbi:enoyl-CoA hydratase/isomerase family protein [Nocardia cyriacigeorgica]|uniref:enoyl-CoA hydratase/isomerase family protein n=1 Tax=Nocardia cyriacigeorgica TaxID=135487 RepID=UPI002455A559|nr:enoyl-CoA hydratase-related protein [Nocardia cyriacigeorgica]
MSARAAAPDFATLTVEQKGAVLIARHSSPPHHFVTTAFVKDLDELTRAVDADDSVRAVVLTGSEQAFFLTHADPGELGGAMTAPLPPVAPRLLRPGWRATRTLMRLPGALRLTESVNNPVLQALAWGYRWRQTILRMNNSSTVYLAAINGTTTGGGHEIALACDLRFVSDASDLRLGQIEILAGLIPGGGGTQRLPRMLGTARALEHMLEGAPITAQQAFELGLVNAIVPDTDLLNHTCHTAARLARRSPAAVRAIKQLTYFATSERFEDALDAEMANFVKAGTQPGMKDALAAFASDLAESGHSPLASADLRWVEGNRIQLQAHPNTGGTR